MKSFINKPNLPVKLLVFVSTSVGIDSSHEESFVFAFLFLMEDIP